MTKDSTYKGLENSDQVAIIETSIDTIANDYLTKSGTKLTEIEKEQFLQLCKEFNLNPFKREIYAIVYGKDEYRNCSIVIGYEVFLKRAYQSKQLNGWKVWTEGEINQTDVNKSTLKACIEIHRKDWEKPFYHEVLFNEYVGLKYNPKTNQKEVNTMWKSKPITMIKKVVIGQGFRLCAPEELEGMPYLEEELYDQEKTPVVKNIINTEAREEILNLEKESESKIFNNPGELSYEEKQEIIKNEHN